MSRLQEHLGYSTHICWLLCVCVHIRHSKSSEMALFVTSVFMAALHIADADIIFCPVVSSIFFFLLFSLPSWRRLDVYHTSRHGVALVRI